MIADILTARIDELSDELWTLNAGRWVSGREFYKTLEPAKEARIVSLALRIERLYQWRGHILAKLASE